MEHVEKALEVNEKTSTELGPRQVVYFKQCVLDPIFMQVLFNMSDKKCIPDQTHSL